MKRIKNSPIRGAYWYGSVAYSPIRKEDICPGNVYYTIENNRLITHVINSGGQMQALLDTTILSVIAPKYFIKLLNYQDIEDLGWEFWEEESTEEVTAYTLVSDSNSYMLTASNEYLKIIVKGSRKELNIHLFRGKVRSVFQLIQIMKMCNIKY